MELEFRVSRILNDEHLAVLALLERLERFLRNHPAAEPPASGVEEVVRMLGDLTAAIEGEVTRHFAFEEEVLFPLIVADGSGELVELLREEHDTIRPVGKELVERARAGLANGFDEADWRTFHRLAGELVDRLSDHATKEQGALLSVLEEMLDADDDNRMADGYLAQMG